MILPNLEFLNSTEKISDCEETLIINFVDKKSKLYGCVDIENNFRKRSSLFGWNVFMGNDQYTFGQEQEFDTNAKEHQFSAQGLKYKIIKTSDKDKLLLKNTEIEASLNIAGIYPIYNFPVPANKDFDEQRNYYESKLWKRAEQRCRFSGELKILKGANKGAQKNIDCFGQVDYLWGPRLWKQLTVYSCYQVQFRDMALNLTCVYFGNVSVANGYFSKKSGNIPIVEVELEHIDLERETQRPKVTEISYLDSQDDRDLVVANKIHSIELPEKNYSKRKFLHYRNFSEFIIIGANKKGIGMEEHYILSDCLSDYVKE